MLNTMVALWVILAVNLNGKMYEPAPKFTQWGMFFTTCYLVCIQFIDPNPEHKPSKNNKIWKYAHFCFTHALFMECIIVPYYWAALRPDILKDP